MIPRFLTSFYPSLIRREQYDYVIVGSGIAGLWCALEACAHGRVAVVTKAARDEGSTKYAQGGIAAALCPQDSPSLHMTDTLEAGAGLCDREAVSILVTEGPQCVKQLVRRGARFDEEHGQLVLAREGAHGIRRIVRARGDQTGREVERALIAQVEGSPVDLYDEMFAVDLLTQNDECLGVLCWSIRDNEFVIFLGGATILASGGAGQLYEVTTNPVVVTGDGAAMAFRAGARLQDMEFVQFHPTALTTTDSQHGSQRVSPRFLISEAVRGEGARLLNVRGERFMPAYHPLAELAPRDIVSKSILEEMQKTHSRYVLLDLTAHSREAIQQRFPTIFETCEEHGIDPSQQPIPVSPAAHYTMGGVKTGSNGETNIRRLYACGEVACTGVHGANRLASNSLLEGMVFGTRAVKAARRFIKHHPLTDPRLSEFVLPREPHRKAASPEVMRTKLQSLMWRQVGLLRSEETLRDALSQIEAIQNEVCQMPGCPAVWELTNMTQLARLIALSALLRTESRGAHRRSDYPDTDNKRWRKHIILERRLIDEIWIDDEPEISLEDVR